MYYFLLRLFFGRPQPLPPGAPVNRSASALTPARWDGVVVADFGDEVLVEWPRLGNMLENKHHITAIQL